MIKVEQAKVGELAEQIRGVTFDNTDSSRTQLPGYMPVLRAGNIGLHGLVFEDLVFVSSARISTKQILRRHDVVVAASSGSRNVVGKAAPVLEDYAGSFGAFCKVLRPGPRVHPGYFAHFFKTQSYRRRISALAAGANINNLRNEHIDDMEIPLPEFGEQRWIAEVLDQAEALLVKRREVTARLNTLTQSIFLDLFGDPTANPKDFVIQPLDRVLARPFQNGAYFPSSAYNQDGGVEMVHMSDAFEGTVVRGQLKRVMCSADAMEKYGLTAADLLVARRSLNYEGSVKPCQIPDMKEPLIFESSLIRLTPEPTKLSTQYLYHYLSNSRVREKFIFPFVTQSTISGINQSNLARVLVVVPPLNLQNEFAHRIASIERLKNTFEVSLSHLENLFGSLQQRAFRGEL